MCERDRFRFGAKKHLDAIGKIGHGSPGRSKTFRFPTLPGVSPPVQRNLVFGVTKLACSSVSDMGVVYLVVPTHTKVKRDSIYRVCHACTHSVSFFLPSVASFSPLLSLSHSRADYISLSSFSFILDLSYFLRHAFFFLFVICCVSRLRSPSLFFWIFSSRFFAFNISTFYSSSLQAS